MLVQGFLVPIMGGKKAVFIVVLILTSILVVFPNIETVKANETIYIAADGSVQGTNKIQREGNVYTFTDDIVGIIAGFFKYNFKKFVLASFLGKLIMNLVLAFSGFYGISWILDIFQLNL